MKLICRSKKDGLGTRCVKPGKTRKRKDHMRHRSCPLRHGGKSSLINAQPLHASYSKGHAAIAHNGNITNAEGLKRDLESRGAIFQSATDTEVILHLMAHEQNLSPSTH